MSIGAATNWKQFNHDQLQLFCVPGISKLVQLQRNFTVIYKLNAVSEYTVQCGTILPPDLLRNY